MMTTPFRQTGPTVVIIASTTANAFQCSSTETVGNQQYVFTNTDTTNDVWITFASNEGNAIAQAIAPTIQLPQLVYRILHATQVTLTGPANAWIGAISSTSTARLEVTPGYGS